MDGQFRAGILRIRRQRPCPRVRTQFVVAAALTLATLAPSAAIGDPAGVSPACLPTSYAGASKCVMVKPGPVVGGQMQVSLYNDLPGGGGANFAALKANAPASFSNSLHFFFFPIRSGTLSDPKTGSGTYTAVGGITITDKGHSVSLYDPKLTVSGRRATLSMTSPTPTSARVVLMTFTNVSEIYAPGGKLTIGNIGTATTTAAGTRLLAGGCAVVSSCLDDQEVSVVGVKIG